MGHVRAQAEQVPFSTHYSAKNYSVAFRCPACQKTQRQSLNFLGNKVMVCDGEKMHKVVRWAWRQEQEMQVDGAQQGSVEPVDKGSSDAVEKP